MIETVESLRQRAVNCKLLAETALTEGGRDALTAMADAYNERVRKLNQKSTVSSPVD